MATLEQAILLAAQAHQGQQDRAGDSYILHPLRVMFRVRSEQARIVAVLHDVIEDTPYTLDELRQAGFSETVLDAVDRLSRREGEAYEPYIERIAPSPLARAVKLADLEDNMHLRHSHEVGEADLDRLRRYQRAFARLSDLHEQF